MPEWSLFALGVAALLIALAVGLLVVPFARLAHLRAKLRRLSLPLVLAAGAIHGLLYMLLVPPWQGPDEHPHFTYVALLDKYNLDNGQVQSIDWSRDRSNEPLIEALSASMTRYNFNRYQLGHPNPGEAVAAASLGTSYRWQLRQPVTYYWLCASAIRGLRALGATINTATNPEAALMVMRGVSFILSMGVITLAWLAGVLLSASGKQWLRLLLPLTVALFPMHAFVSVLGNNDILAGLAVSALFVALIALLRWPSGLRGVSLAVLAVLLAAAGAFTKSTALAASLPMLGLGLLVWVGMLLTRGLARRSEPRRRVVVRVGIPLALALLAILGLAALPAVAFKQEEAAAGWHLRYVPLQRAAQVYTESAHDGRYVLELPPGSRGAQQVLLPASYHPELKVTLSGWARLLPTGQDGAAQAGKTPKARIGINDLRSSFGTGEVELAPTGAWVPLTATATINEGRSWVVFRLFSDARQGKVQFDDLRLDVQSVNRPWDNTLFSPALLNPSFEQASLEMRDEIARFVPLEARQTADVLLNPRQFDIGLLWREYVSPQYRSFWGNFGWLAVPLPEWGYVALGWLSGLSLFGLVGLGVTRIGRWGSVEWLGLVCLVSLVVAILAGFAKQAMFLATEGGGAYPQGRYLFVLIVPIAWLLLSGIWGVLSLANSIVTTVSRRSNRASPRVSEAKVDRDGQGNEAAEGNDRRRASEHSDWASWWATSWAAGLFLFAAFCLLALVVPFFHG